MKRATDSSRNIPRDARPGRLPRPVVWLALLAALAVAALGALFSQARLESSPGTAHHILGRGPAPAV